MLSNSCLFTSGGFVLREEGGVILLDRSKLRQIDAKAPLVSLAGDVCRRCPASIKITCNKDIEAFHDGTDWTAGLFEPD